MKKNKSTIILILVFFVGLSVMLYPTLSDYVNQLHQSRAVATYAEDVDKLEVGDTFTITVLDRVLTYEVDNISIVLPTETDNLKVTEGRDYVTLMLAALVCGVCRKRRRERRAR